MANSKDILDSGTAFHSKKYKGKLSGLAWKLEQAEGRTRTAGKSLLLIAAFLIIPTIFSYLFKGGGLLDLVANILMGGVFIGCSFLSRKKPVLSFTIALVLYLLIMLILAILLPTAFGQGIIWKLVFTGLILAGLINALYCISLRKKLIAMEKKFPEDVEIS